VLVSKGMRIRLQPIVSIGVLKPVTLEDQTVVLGRTVHIETQHLELRNSRQLRPPAAPAW
jgi:hypothetical protein